MSEFPKSFDPEAAERKWYEFWEREGYFRPEINPGGEPFCIVIPPPNVTGQLHMGHALNATIQDVIIRWKRMQGFRALWVPGMDHAGIATQNVVERQLATDGTDRHAMGREKFIERVWQWKEEYGGRIINQLRKVGASCDWSRERFTMDAGLSRAVREVFVKLHEEGLIYRDTRLINWCPRCLTALSDLEVEHEELSGTLTYMRYPMADGKGSITVATTRPETMLGDTGVAVNPNDERYAHHIGREIELPLTGRKIPVVADAEVDPAFGTGAVKVTPAHDFNDEAIAKRQSPALQSIVVIGEDGRMTAKAGQRYAGLDRYEARRKVTEDLQAQGLIEKVDTHQHSVGHCYRCKTVVEPYGTPQWFVRIQPLADEAIKAVRDGDIRIVPEGWVNSYNAWMENIRDWCITRQIWWGHRVPVWYCDACGETIVSREDPTECTKCGGALRQDEDVLDTWFSSALWPFSTLGWPDETENAKDFYPTGLLVTGFDILFFWVARMIMMGLKFKGEVPFRDVYIHALVRDKDGQKMSKSKGNVIDPLTISSRFGADAFRFTLAAFAAQGRDVRFDETRVEGYKNFINKLWNATRYILMNLPPDAPLPTETGLRAQAEAQLGNSGAPTASRWILSRLARTADEVNKALTEYRFNDAASAVYQFAWHEFCDWYIEMSKASMDDNTRATLLYTLETVLRLLHPFMPFVTEEIWQQLPIKYERDSVMISRFPQGLPTDKNAEAACALLMQAVMGVRTIRGELNLPPADVLDVLVKTSGEDIASSLKADMPVIERLARCSIKECGPGVAKPESAYTTVTEAMEIYVRLAGIDVSGELDRLGKELKKAEAALIKVQNKLANEDFIRRAPADVVVKEKAKYDELSTVRERLVESIEKIKALG
jgi:valyl-tRNA synthetase